MVWRFTTYGLGIYNIDQEMHQLKKWFGTHKGKRVKLVQKSHRMISLGLDIALSFKKCGLKQRRMEENHLCS